MRSLMVLAFKDLLLLTRDWMALIFALVIPLLFALFFGTLYGGSRGAGMKVAVVDEDDSPASRALVGRLERSAALKVSRPGRAEAQEEVRKGELAAFVVIPAGYGEKLNFFGGDSTALQVGIDPSRRAEEGYLQGLLMEAVYAGFQEQFTQPQQMRQSIERAKKDVARAPDLKPLQRKVLETFFQATDDFLAQAPQQGLERGPSWQPVKLERIDVAHFEKRPRSAYEVTFPSSVLWGVLGSVTCFAVSLVAERRGGTLLRLRVAPLTLGQVLAGKGLACFLASVLVAVVLLGIGWRLLGVRLNRPLELAAAIACTAFCFSGIMMLVSTLGKTEAAVSGGAWGIFLPMAMLGGGMVPLFMMPEWLQVASNVSPVKWGVLALEGAVWRDFTWGDMLLPCAVLVGVGLVTFGLGVGLLSRQDV
jgi:ABC-2 type transport system permease protein